MSYQQQVDENDPFQRIERLENLLLSKPNLSGCNHTFPIWMVIPMGGCVVKCPVCGTDRFINGPTFSW